MQFPPIVPQNEIEDFNRRWQSARLSALRSGCPEASIPEAADPDSEKRLLEAVCAVDGAATRSSSTGAQNAVLRGVFDNSRKLALGFAKRLGLTFETGDFRGLLEVSGIPCAKGDWSERAGACVLTRNECGFCRSVGSYACDYWREAMDGLVMGLGEKERFVRHASARHGDANCLDVFYTEAAAPGADSPAWGPVPEHMAMELFEIAAYFHRTTGIALVLKGFREGTLFFEFGMSTDPLCGNGGLLAHKFDGMIKEKFPGLAVKDVTPQAVLGTTGG